jgi:hypothetical protein
MLPTIIEKTQPISGATANSPSNPGLVPYIPAGADGYLHTSGEFKPIAGTGENKYFSPQLDYNNTIVIEKIAPDPAIPDPPATEAEELEFNEFIAPSNGQLIAYGSSYTTTGKWLGYWAHIYPADNSPKLKIDFTGTRLPEQNYESVLQLCSGPYTLSKGDKFYMVCNGAVKKLDRTVYTFIPFKYQNVSEATTFKYQKTNVIYRDRVIRKLGEIFIYAGTDIPDNSLPLDGQIITECDIQYPDLYTWIINNAKTITLTEYETKISQYGQCGHFGLDTTTKTVRLPKIKAFIQNAESVSEIAEVENAGLPNITGDVKYMLYNDPPTPERSGAISIDQGQVFNNYSPSGDTALRSCRLVINASWYNSIYGNSTTVTPDNVKYRYFICTKNEFNELEKLATHASMPVSDRTKYTTYPVTMVNGSLNNFHTAPADGYVRIITDPANSNSSSGIILVTYVASTTEDDITAMLNGTSMIEKEILAESTIVTNIRHRLFVPIEKGNKFMVWFNNPDNIQILDYSFIPCNGSL